MPVKAPQLRHPGEGREPHLVIPAKAGTQRLPLVIPAKAGIQRLPLVIPAEAGIQLLLRSSVFRDNRPRIPACFARHPWRAKHFSLLAQREVTKRKAPRVRRPPLRGGFATGGRVPLTAHPVPQRNRRDPSRRPFGPFRPPFAAPHGDPGSKAKQSIGWALAHRGGAQRWAKAHPINHGLGFCGRMPRSALLRGPPRPRRGREGKSP